MLHRQINALADSDHYFFVHLDRRFHPAIAPGYLKDPRVHFVENRLKVSWGGFSVVKATLLLIEEALATDIGFDYFVLMSGQCFPIKSNRYIRDILTKSRGRLFIDVNPLPSERLEGGGLDKFHYPSPFDALSWLNKENLRLLGRTVEYKKIAFKLAKYAYVKLGIKRNIPNGLTPCFGSQWWALSRDAVRYVLEYSRREKRIYDFFRYTWAPDELFFQTVLYNSPLASSIENESLWYINWRTNGSPKVLTLEDFDALSNSPALFARKFESIGSGSLLEKIESKRRSY